jgi:hypothetical protein
VVQAVVGDPAAEDRAGVDEKLLLRAVATGKGLTARMTYYEAPGGAKVFAAGAFTLAGEVISNRIVRQLVANLWTHLARP